MDLVSFKRMRTLKLTRLERVLEDSLAGASEYSRGTSSQPTRYRGVQFCMI